MRIRLKLHPGFVTLVAVYALTIELRNEEESVEFYKALQDVVRQVPGRDMLMVLGDFNARVGNDVEALHGVAHLANLDLFSRMRMVGGY